VRALALSLWLFTFGCVRESASPETQPPRAAQAGREPSRQPAAAPGWLGVAMSPAPEGVQLAHVGRGTPAALAGLVALDIVTHVNDEAVREPATLQKRIAELGAGRRVTLATVRNGETRNVVVTLGARPVEVDTVAKDLLGRPAPALEGAVGLQGADVSSLRGKVAIVDFYATWCGPCHYTIPMLTALHQRYAAQGFRVLGISTEDDALVLRFSAARGIVYDLARDELGLVTRNYGIRSLPTLFVIDRAGSVRRVFEGVPDSTDLEQTVQTLLAEPQ
jgi:thiol-disulfide isomerase/thioredoxin